MIGSNLCVTCACGVRLPFIRLLIKSSFIALGLFPSLGLLPAQIPRRPSQPQRPVPTRPQQRQPGYFQWLKSRQDLQDFSRLMLKNGLRLLVAENHESPLATLIVHIAQPRGLPADPDYWVPPETLRYLFFGTQKRTARQISDQLWMLGIQTAAECGPDGVILTARFPADQVNRAVDLFSDLLTGAVFPEAALNDVQNAILREEGRNWTRILSGAGYQFPWIGNQEKMSWEQVEQGIRGVTRAQILDFWNRSALAGQTTVVIYGDFLPESVLDSSVRKLKDFPATRPGIPAADARRVPASTPAAAKNVVFSYRQMRAGIKRSVVRVVFPIPGRREPDFPAVFLASYALAEGRMSYLSRQLNDIKKFGASVRMFIRSFGSLSGQLCLQFEVGSGDLDSLEIELFSALERWRKAPRIDADRDRALAMAASDFFARMETFEGRAQSLLRNELEGGYKSWVQALAALTKVSAEDMTRVAEKYFAFGGADVTELLPSDAEPRNYTADSFRQTFERILSAAANEAPKAEAAGEPQQEAAEVTSLLTKFAATEIAPAPYRTSILRGPELQIWEIHSLPLVDVGIFFPGAMDKETPEKAGLTRLMLGVLLRNSAKYAYEDRFTSLERWGGRVEPVMGKDYFGYRLRVLAPHAEQALGLMLDVIRNRTFVDQDVEQQLRLQSIEAVSLMDALEFRLPFMADRQLYGEHPYGKDHVGPGPGLKELKAAQLLEWHSLVMDDVLPMIAVIGDTPGTSLATYFSKHFSGSRYKILKPSIGATVVPKESATLDLPLVWQGQKGLSVSLLGPEGENDETLLVQMAALAVARRSVGGSAMASMDLNEASSSELAVAWKGGRLSLAAFSQQGDPSDLGRLLADAMSTAESRDSLEALKNALASRMRAGTQRRLDMLQKLAAGFFSLGQFYSVSRLIEKANAVNLDEYQEAVSRYFSQKQQVLIYLGQR